MPHTHSRAGGDGVPGNTPPMALDELFMGVADDKFRAKMDLWPGDDGDSLSSLRKTEVLEYKTILEEKDIKVVVEEVPAEDGLPYSRAHCIALVVTVCGSMFASTFNIQAVVIILPSIGRELEIPDSRLQWIMSAYTLAFGCFLLFWGRVADVYGMKNIFVYGTAWLALTTLINPFVPNEIGFDLFRGLQGLGAAANVPTALGILGTTFQHGRAKTWAFAAYGAGAPLGSIFGNILAGVIAAYSSWRWVFGAMAILSGSIAIAGVLFIPGPKAHAPKADAGIKPTVDWIGASLVTLGLFVLLFSLTEVNIVGWATVWIPILVVISLLLISLFVVWQVRLERQGQRAPLMKVSMFRSKQFSAVMVIMALFSSSFSGFLVYATYFYQNYQGLDALQTTLRFIPTGVAGCIASFAVAFVLDRVPTWTILLFGNICVSLASLLFAIPISPDTSYWLWGMEAMSLSVIGSDITWPCVFLFTSSALPAEDQALGGALVNAVGQVGRSIGLAAATAIQIGVMAAARGADVQNAGPIRKDDAASLDGLRAGAWFNLAVGACSVALIVAAFRGTGVLGKAPPPPLQSIEKVEARMDSGDLEDGVKR